MRARQDHGLSGRCVSLVAISTQGLVRNPQPNVMGDPLPAARPRAHRVPVPDSVTPPACCICGTRYAREWVGAAGDSGQLWWPLPYCFPCCAMPGMPLRPHARSPFGSVALPAEAALWTEAASQAQTISLPGAAPPAELPPSQSVTDLPVGPQVPSPSAPASGSSSSSLPRSGLLPLEEF